MRKIKKYYHLTFFMLLVLFSCEKVQVESIDNQQLASKSSIFHTLPALGPSTFDTIQGLVTLLSTQANSVIDSIVYNDMNMDSLNYYFNNDPNGDEMAALWGMSTSQLVEYNLIWNSNVNILIDCVNRYYSESIQRGTQPISNPLTPQFASNISFGQLHNWAPPIQNGSTVCDNVPFAACLAAAVLTGGPVGALGSFLCYCSYCSGDIPNKVCKSTTESNYFREIY